MPDRERVLIGYANSVIGAQKIGHEEGKIC